ncbi:MAG: glycosyltransferase family 4 protein [Chloroflexota bacterium]
MFPESFPKTLIVDLANGYGGATSRVLSLVMNSPRDRIAVAGLESGTVIKRARELGLPAYAIGKSKLDFSILSRLVSLIQNEGFEVLDSQNIQAKFWTSLAAMRARFAFVSTIHSWYAIEHGQASLKGRLYTALELMTNRNLDLYISVSKKDQQLLFKSGYADEMVHLIYNAVNIDPESIPGDSRWLNQKFNLPADAIVCTAVGRLVWMKAHDILIEAVSKIADEVPQLLVLIVGEGELHGELQGKIKAAGLEARVHLVGYQDRDSVLSIVKASDIFVMPSHYEGTPVALLEAAALGRPILATRAGGVPEMVEDGQHALLVPTGDAEALSKGLVHLAKDREVARTLGLNAQHWLKQRFSLERQLAETWDAYRKAWSKRYKAASKS